MTQMAEATASTGIENIKTEDDVLTLINQIDHSPLPERLALHRQFGTLYQDDSTPRTPAIIEAYTNLFSYYCTDEIRDIRGGNLKALLRGHPALSPRKLLQKFTPVILNPNASIELKHEASRLAECISDLVGERIEQEKNAPRAKSFLIDPRLRDTGRS